MTSSTRNILIGLGLGALVGVFLGERAAILQFAADGYVRLLQMTVLPYVVVSMVAGIGSLDVSRNGNDSRSPTGVVLSAGAGYEWFVAKAWSLGVIARAPEGASALALRFPDRTLRRPTRFPFRSALERMGCELSSAVSLRDLPPPACR